MQIIQLDIAQHQYTEVIHAKQGDVGRKVKLTLSDNGKAWIIPGDAVFSVWYSGSSGEGNYSVIGDHSAFLVNGCTVEVELITQMLTNPGGGSMCVILNDSEGQQMGLWNIMYMCEPVPGANSAEAESYYTALTELAGSLATDATLAVSGKPADAKAVGDALANKAPGGLGLGTELKNKTGLIGDLDDPTLKTGFYYTPADAYDAPETDFSGGPLFVINWQNNQLCRQLLMNDDLTRIYCRRYQNTAWDPWEWINPPMNAGIVYRTPERYDGRPVYTQRLVTSNLPNNGHLYLPMGLNGSDYRFLNVMDGRASVLSGGKFYVNPSKLSTGELTWNVCENNGQWCVDLFTTFDGSTMSAEITLKFTLD